MATRNPAITHQLIWFGIYPMIYHGWTIHPNGGWEWDFWTINSIKPVQFIPNHIKSEVNCFFWKLWIWSIKMYVDKTHQTNQDICCMDRHKNANKFINQRFPPSFLVQQHATKNCQVWKKSLLQLWGLMEEVDGLLIPCLASINWVRDKNTAGYGFHEILVVS